MFFIVYCCLEVSKYRYKNPNTNLEFENNGSSGSFAHYNGGIYKLFFPKYDVIRKEVKTIYPQGCITERTDYHKSDVVLPITTSNYQRSVKIRKLNSETLRRGCDSLVTLYTYPHEMQDSTHKSMALQQFFLPVLTQEKKHNGHTIQKEDIRYQKFSGMVLPEYEMEYKHGAQPETTIQYLEYTNTGQLAKYKEQGKPITSLTWGNGDNLLLEKTEGDSLTTRYTYNNKKQLTAIETPNGNVNYYNYDDFGRLKEVKNRNNEFVKKFSYQYQNK